MTRPSKQIGAAFGLTFGVANLIHPSVSLLSEIIGLAASFCGFYGALGMLARPEVQS